MTAQASAPKETPALLVRELVLSGGGTNGLAMLGALHALRQRGRLRRVRRIVGTSVGGVIGLLLAVGYAPHVIFDVLARISFDTFSEVDCDSVLMFYDTLGAVDGNAIMRLLRVMLQRAGFAPSTTFRQLHARVGVALVITGYNVLRTATEAFDHVTHPDMAVLLAARITISIPLYFRPVEYGGQIYVDGGVLEPTPVRFCKRKGHTLVVVLTCASYSGRAPVPAMPLQMTDYVDLLFRGPGRALHQHCLRMRKRHPRSVLEIDLTKREGGAEKSRFLDLGMDRAEKTRLFAFGQREAERFVSAPEHALTVTTATGPTATTARLG
jgi:predicted acylesterase/phospholipase RssA